MEDENGGLFNIEVSSDESDSTQKLPRDFQTEEDFNNQRKQWRPKIETGEIHKTLTLPINNPSKPESQTILHAIEELYFFKRYEEARKVAGDALKGELSEDFRGVVSDYLERSERKIGVVKGGA